MKFKYIVMTEDKDIQEGLIEVETKSLAVAQLQAKGFVILDLFDCNEKEEDFSQNFKGNKQEKRRKRAKLIKNKKITLRDKQMFFDQISVLIDSGISVVDSLSMISENISKQKFYDIVTDLKKKIEDGLSLSDAMAKHPKCFNQTIVSIIYAGEESGTLVESFQRLSESLERTVEVQQKIVKALIYPVILVVVTFFILLILFLKVIPVFVKIFSSLNVSLPLLTLFFIEVSNIVRRYFFYIFLAVILCYGILKKMFAKPRFRIWVDSYLLKIPVLGSLKKDGLFFDIALMFGMLLKNGISVIESLDLVKNSLNNLFVKSILEDIKESVSKGKSVSEEIVKYSLFPNIFIQMIRIGEETGRLVPMLDRLSHFYHQRALRKVDIFLSLFEPFALLFVGSLLGFIVIAMFLPIFSMSSVLSNV